MGRVRESTKPEQKNIKYLFWEDSHKKNRELLWSSALEEPDAGIGSQASTQKSVRARGIHNPVLQLLGCHAGKQALTCNTNNKNTEKDIGVEDEDQGSKAAIL